MSYGSIGTSRAWAMLTARALQYDGSRGGYGGLKQADIAAMLGVLDRRFFLAGMFLEAGDWASLGELEERLFFEIVKLAYERRWDLQKDGIVHARHLGHLALYEAAGRAMICPKCDGAGTLLPHGQVMPVQCDRCDGRRKLPLTQKSRAEMMEISESSWSRCWAMRYENVDSIIVYWLAEANRHLRKQLRASGNEIKLAARVA